MSIGPPRHIPHITDYPVQFITFRLADALPYSVQLSLATEAARGASGAPARGQHLPELELDRGYGSCLLGQPKAAAIVRDSIFHTQTRGCSVVAWVVMPNHVHLVLVIPDELELSVIIRDLKRYTAAAINRALSRRGPLWQKGYWDRCIRDPQHLGNCIDYIHYNPVGAGLVEHPEKWRYSSAGDPIDPGPAIDALMGKVE